MLTRLHAMQAWKVAKLRAYLSCIPMHCAEVHALTLQRLQRIGLITAPTVRQFFRYCLCLRGGGSSHFAPHTCTNNAPRRDEPNKGGD